MRSVFNFKRKFAFDSNSCKILLKKEIEEFTQIQACINEIWKSKIQERHREMKTHFQLKYVIF